MADAMLALRARISMDIHTALDDVREPICVIRPFPPLTWLDRVLRGQCDLIWQHWTHQ